MMNVLIVTGYIVTSIALIVAAWVFLRYLPKILKPIIPEATHVSKLKCLRCGAEDNTEIRMKGSGYMTFFLFWFWLIPGLIYSAWRGSTRHPVCRVCGGDAFVKLKEGEKWEKETADTASKHQPTGIHELEKLAELRDKGIITNEEFINRKKKILES